MKIKNLLQIVASAALMASAGVAWAGKQGISFYVGLGLSGVAPDSVNGFEYDPVAAGNAFIGMEEDGWALEYNATGSLKAGTSDPATEYSISGGVASLGYRTIESRSGFYYLISFGLANFDVVYAETALPDDKWTSDGNVISLGLGMRMNRTERIELDYSYMNLSQSDSTLTTTESFDAHMLTLKYIWGGTPYDHQF